MSERFDDLEEMHIPDSAKKSVAASAGYEEVTATVDLDNDVLVPTSVKERPPVAPKAKGKKTANQPSFKTPQAAAAAQKRRNETIAIVAVCAVVFIAILVFVWGVSTDWGRGDGSNALNDRYTSQVKMAQPDASKTAFLNESNIPELSSEGVKGLLKQAYYTVDGDLAVVLNLSNGTSSEQEVVRVNARVFNDKDETVAQQTVDRFDPKCVVPAMGHGEVYFVIDRSNVVLRNDPLSKLGVMLEIASNGGANNDSGAQVGNGPKDIAVGRSYYENLGNRPELSEEGIKATVIRARYTNDGSLAICFALSNGTAEKRNVSKIDLQLLNGNSGATIVSYAFDHFETPCHVESKGFAEVELIVDASYVSLSDDPLSSLTTTISVSSNPLE